MSVHLMTVPVSHPNLGGPWADRDSAHKAVMSLFPSRLPGPERERRASSSILYRIEPQRVVIQSTTAPDEARLDDSIRRTVLDGLLTTLLQPGMPVRFIMDVNPVVNSTNPGSGPKRVPVPEEELPSWVSRRLAPGFTDVLISNVTMSVQATHAEANPLKIASIDGYATVDTAQEAHSLIVNGVGRGKAYGCGLLTTLPT